MDPVGLRRVMMKIFNQHLIIKVVTSYYKISRKEEKFYSRLAELKCTD